DREGSRTAASVPRDRWRASSLPPASLAKAPEDGLGDERGGIDPACREETAEAAERAHLEHHPAPTGRLHEVDAGEEQSELLGAATRQVDDLSRGVGDLVAAARPDRRHPLRFWRHSPVRTERPPLEHRHAEITARVLDEALQVEGTEALRDVGLE